MGHGTFPIPSPRFPLTIPHPLPLRTSQLTPPPPLQNKTLSDDTDAVLALQGVGWMMRKAIAWATVTLSIKQYVDDTNLTHIDTDQTATGGIKGTQELRQLDWIERPHDDHIFGKLVGKSRWIATGTPEYEALQAFMREGWLEEGEQGGPNGESHVHSWVVNEEKGWTAEQIWGFAMVEEKRYYVRRVVVTKGKEVLSVRLVYDWQGTEA
jgi:hypothetical protein